MWAVDVPMMFSSRIGVEHVSIHDSRWQAFVAQSEPSLFNHPRWGSVIERTYGFPAAVALAIRDGEVLGGLPYAEIRDFRGVRRICFAFADVCEPLGAPVWPALEEGMSLAGIPWHIRSRLADYSLASSVREVAVHQSIALPRSLEEAHAKCDPKQRYAVRQAEKAGLTYRRIEDASAIDIFYELHSRVRKEKHHLLSQPRAFFEELVAEYFPQDGFVLVAELEHRPLAAMFFLRCGKTLYYKFSASDLQALDYRPNHFLLWKAVEEALAAGYESIDLGISEAESLIRFKRRLGARSVPVYAAKYFEVEKANAVAAMDQTLGRLTAVLTGDEVPLAAAQAAGELLYRFFV